MIYIFLFCCILLSYIIGSTPTAYFFGKIIKKIDIRNYGSGNIGATNAFRVLGTKLGILTLIIDILKGLIPILIFDYFIKKLNFNISENVQVFRIIIGIATVLGHNFTFYLKFKGGKGVATTTGVLLALTPGPVLYTILFFLIVLLIIKYMSIASMTSSICYVVILFVLDYSLELRVFGIILMLLIILRHKSNIKRLLAGTEPKIINKK